MELKAGNWGCWTWGSAGGRRGPVEGERGCVTPVWYCSSNTAGLVSVLGPWAWDRGVVLMFGLHWEGVEFGDLGDEVCIRVYVFI